MGVLGLALGSCSPLLGVHMLYTPGFRYASLDVGVYCIVESTWQTHDDGSEEIPCHKAAVTTLGHVAAILLSIDI